MKYCKDCKYYEPENRSVFVGIFKPSKFRYYSECQRIIEDPEKGFIKLGAFADIERKSIDSTKCGIEGKYFQEK